MKSRTRDKAISLLLTINLIFNSFAPFLTFARPVVSAEPLKAEIDFKTIENSFDISVNTKEEIEYVLSWKNQDGLQGTSITKAGGEDQEFQRDIYAGIKSGPDARRDTVIRGIYKVEVKSQHWITAIKFSLDDGKLIEENKTEYLPEGLDFTDNEIKWIEEGDQITPTPTLEATSTPTPTIIEQGDILEGVFDQNFMTSDVDGVVQTNVIESYQCRADSLNGCLITDKEDYAPTEVALITGYGFAPNTEYTIRISSSDEPAVTYEALVTTDEHGSFTVSYQLDGTYRPNYLVQLFDSNGVEVTRVTFTDSNPSADLDQYANDTPVGWVNGNLNSSKATYYEGDSVPYRLKFDGLDTSVSHTVIIEWDTAKSGKHAEDYITSYDRTVGSANPCAGIIGCGSPSTFPIPVDPQVASSGVTQIGGNFTLFNGLITNVSGYSYPGGSGFLGDKSAQIAITFTALVDNPVLAWGGHISHRADWGSDNSAIAIPGSPYHMRLIELDGKGGNQDRSLSADAVIFPASITIIKAATPESPTSFSFVASPAPLDNFSLVDDGSSSNTKLFSNIIDFDNYSISEFVPAGWSLDEITCEVTSFNGGSQIVNKPSVSINLKEGENVTCTFSNLRESGHLIVQKTTLPAADPTIFTINATGSGTITGGGAGTVTDTADYDYEVTPGTYSVTETVPDGWNKTGDTCQDVVIGAGETKYCELTNTKTPKLTVVKVVTNDNGGTKTVSDFPLFVDGNPVTSGVANSFSIGSHIVSETTDSTYSSTISGDCDVNGNITLAAGDNKTCTITNNDSAPSLGLRKTITKDNGGQNNATDWILTATGTGDTPTNLSGTTPVDSGSNFKADTYTLGETGPSGYSAGNWICTGGGTQNGNTITLGLGESAICTINNDDQPGRLIVKKVLTQDDGGDEDYEDFSFKVNGGSSIDFESDGQNEIVVNSGTYTVVEDTAAGYDTSYSNCTDVFIPNGGSATCTITNDDIAPTLKLQKNVLGSEALDAGDWDLTASGEAGFTDSGDSITFHEVLANETYALTESMVEGYTAGNWSCDNTGVQGNVITLGLDEEVTCTITNTRDAGNIEILKLIDLDGDLTTTDDREPYQGWVVDVDQDGADTDDPTLLVTDFEGKSSATGIKTGEYWVSEGSVQGYEVLSGTCTVNGQSTGNGGLGKSSFGDVTVEKDTTTYCTFINAPNSTLHGYKWHDEDLSGGPEAGNDEDLLSGWTIYLYKAIDEDVYSLVDSMVTDNGLDHFGWYWFENLVPGDYRICEENQAGWNQTYPTNDIDNCHEVNLPLDSSGEMITREVLNAVSGPMYNFGNISLGKVNVTKYNDLNGNGMRDDGEPTLPNWEITLSGKDSIITDENGVAEFDGIVPGNYVLDEVIQGGWEQTAITCSVPVDPTPTPTTPVNMTGTPTPTPVLFNNICHWNEGADKWNALSIPDSNMGHDDHEMDYPYGGSVDSKGHPVKDPHHKDDPELNGDAWCDANRPDQRVSALGFGIGAVEAQEVEIDGHEITVEPGKIVSCEIGNRQITPELQISKSNDGVDRSPGDIVTYTIKIKALNSMVLGVVLKDLLPEGFVFQNVLSIIKNGTEDMTESVGNPNYASPGTYNLGDMNEDDEIVVKYTARIDGAQEFGLYKDIAWAKGTDTQSNKVLASAQPEGYVDDNFVGTAVRVNGNYTEGGNVAIAEEGQVLGASTTMLPATGADGMWVTFAGILIALGLSIIVLWFMIKQKKMKFFVKKMVVMLLFGVTLFATGQVYASDLSIRLSEPKTPTKNSDFKLVFTILDLTESGNPITAKCFYKKNLSDGWTQFDTDKNISAGGNSDFCQVNSGIVNTSGQIYYFKATADNGSTSDDSELQGLVSVTFDDSDPGAPTNYKKEKISSCQYKISFKTANDGMTSRVEIYRSESTSMKLDGSTRVGDVAVSPDTESTFTESVPDCNKTYYYIVRAFNPAGNASGPIGDSVTITTTIYSSAVSGETTGAIPVVNVTLAGGTEGEGQVLGEDKTASESPTQSPEEIDVKGASTSNKVGSFVSKNRNYIAGLLALIIAIGVYVFIKKRKTA